MEVIELTHLTREARGYMYTFTTDNDFNNLSCVLFDFPKFEISPEYPYGEWYIRMELVIGSDYFNIILVNTYRSHKEQKPPTGTEMYIIFSIVTECGYEVNRQEKHLSFKFDQPERIFEKFVKKDFFDENNFLDERKFTIRLRLYFFPEDKTVTIPRLNLGSPDFGKLLESKAYSDVRLVVQDEEFHVHKCILTARSPVFTAMFERHMRENNVDCNVVKIADVKVKVMAEMLRFIYANNVENISTYAKDLLAAADKYKIEQLKDLCENVIIETLNVDNVGELLTFADMYRASKLKAQIVDFIKCHKNSIDRQTLQEKTKSVSFSILDLIDYL